MIYFNTETRCFAADPEKLNVARNLTGTQDLSEDDKQRAAYRLVNRDSIRTAMDTPGKLKKDVKKGPLGVKRALQGGKKAQYGNAAGRLATSASIVAGRDKEEIKNLAGRYNGAVRGSMELAKQLTKKDNVVKRAVNKVTGKPNRRVIDNILDSKTYKKSLDAYRKGDLKGRKNAAKQLKKISNEKLDYNALAEQLN